MLRIRMFGLLSMLTLAGCATAAWQKAGATQQDFAHDSYEREKDARQSGYYGTGIIGAMNMQTFNNRCMVAHGYSQEAEAQTGPTRRDILNVDARIQARAECHGDTSDTRPGYYECFEEHRKARLAAASAE